MKKIIIIGGSRGIGKAIIHALLPSHQIINISRSVPEYSHANLSHHSCDVITGDLPEINEAEITSINDIFFKFFINIIITVYI